MLYDTREETAFMVKSDLWSVSSYLKQDIKISRKIALWYQAVSSRLTQLVDDTFKHPSYLTAVHIPQYVCTIPVQSPRSSSSLSRVPTSDMKNRKGKVQIIFIRSIRYIEQTAISLISALPAFRKRLKNNFFLVNLVLTLAFPGWPVTSHFATSHQLQISHRSKASYHLAQLQISHRSNASYHLAKLKISHRSKASYHLAKLQISHRSKASYHLALANVFQPSSSPYIDYRHANNVLLNLLRKWLPRNKYLWHLPSCDLQWNIIEYRWYYLHLYQFQRRIKPADEQKNGTRRKKWNVGTILFYESFQCWTKNLTLIQTFALQVFQKFKPFIRFGFIFAHHLETVFFGQQNYAIFWFFTFSVNAEAVFQNNRSFRFAATVELLFSVVIFQSCWFSGRFISKYE